MHPKKRELLDLIAASADEHDKLMHHTVGVALRPHVYGWRQSLRAVIPLPIIGISAICHGAAYLAAASTKERNWERSHPRGRDVTDLAT